MDEPRRLLLGLLADGAWHSGAKLGATLGCSRAAVWKQIRVLKALGLRLASERGRGYRLDAPLELLTAEGILTDLAPVTRAAVVSLEVLLSTASTSDRLAGAVLPAPGQMLVCVAEYQSGGRGRRGRRWLSPLGSGVCLSLAWCYEVAPRNVAALGLVVGVAVIEALGVLGVSEASLKWPNDVMVSGRKLGGILVDVAGESGGPLRVIIGIGLNVHTVPELDTGLAAESGGAHPIALDQLIHPSVLSRNRLVSELVNALSRDLVSFAVSGFAGFAETWRRHDCLLGRPVTVTSGTRTSRGVARGIGDDGSLLVESNGSLCPIVAGDVTLRESA